MHPTLIRNQYLVFIILFFSGLAMAQKPVSITFGADPVFNGSMSLLQEDVAFNPNLGVGLTESQLSPIASLQLGMAHEKSVDAPISEAKMFRLRFNSNGINKTWMLFMQPGDQLKAVVGADNEIKFSGENAFYQEFLKSYFLENQYQYLPVFGYKPDLIDNQMVLAQSDSLTQLRLQALAAFKAKNKVVPSFETYVKATTMAEPLVLSRLIQERIMRKNRVKRLEPEQQQLLEEYTLATFVLMPDAALLSQSYRNELRNWMLIPTLQKYPLNNDSRYETSPEALKEVYRNAEVKMVDHPKQKEYLLTYWLNYAVSSIPTLEPAKELLAKYATQYPSSDNTAYLTKQVQTKGKMVPGAVVPDLELLKLDGSKIKLSALKNKPLVLVFAYSIGQHEPDLKKMEEKYLGKVQFAYITVISGMNLATLNKYLKDRPNAIHLMATEEDRQFLEANFAIGIRYPYMVIGADSLIVERWIPQVFPANAALESAIEKSLK